MSLTMDAGPRYLEGTTVGSGRDIIGVRRDRIADIISTGREIISRAKGEKILPDTITGATAALLVTIAGYGEPLSEGQWRELAGVVGGIMRDSTYADLARLRTDARAMYERALAPPTPPRGGRPAGTARRCLDCLSVTVTLRIARPSHLFDCTRSAAG